MTAKGSKKTAATTKKGGKTPTPVKPAPKKAAPISSTKKKADVERSKKGVAAPKSAVKKTPPVPQPAKKAVASGVKGRGVETPRKTKPAAPKARSLQPKKLEEFRVQLLQKHRELFESYMSSKGDSRSRQSDGTEDYIDYAVSSYDREFLLSLTELEQKQLMLIEDALRRLDRGEFSRCMHCAQQIPTKRLEVQPWARYCVSCQELEDQGLLEKPEFEHDEEGEEPRVVEDEDVDLEVESEVEYQEELGLDEDADEDEEENLSL